MEPSGTPGPRRHRTFGDTGGMAERWHWNMTAAIGNRFGSTAGIEATRDEACDAVEHAYEAMKAAIRDQE